MGPAERPPEDGCGGDHLDTTDAWVEDAGGPLSSLGDWMRLLSGVERRHASGRVTVDAYGDGDRPYLVIEKYLSRWPPRAVDQYVVLPHGGPRARLALLGFIADCGAGLPLVLARLAAAPYDEDGKARFGDVSVTCNRVSERMGPMDDRPRMPPPRSAAPDDGDFVQVC
ncbi:MAG TPA: hypothetical protein VF457_11695 [Burkholderiaceae bacterium]